MKQNSSLIATSLMLAALVPLHSRAATNTWNNGAANFTWDTTSANWTSPTIWVDGGSALFGATGVGEVTLGGPITVQNQTFSTAGYTIVGAGNALTLAGTTPTIAANADSTNAASLNGTDGLTIQGTGVLTLQGDVPNLDGNHYTGGTYVRSGTLMLGVRGANASGTSYAVDSIEALDAGATVKFDTPFDGVNYTTPALHQIAAHSTAFVSHLHMTGGTFDLNDENRSQHVPIPEGTGLIINGGTNAQAGLIMVADGSNHVFSGVIADHPGPLNYDAPQGPGGQIGILNMAAAINGGGGEWTLTASNTFSGSTRLQFASIKLAGNGTIGFPTTNGRTGPLRIYGPSHLDLNGCNQTIALMTGGDANGKIYNTAVGTVSTLTFGYGNEPSTSRNANMQYLDNPGTGGILAMTKIGTNCIQTLSGVNTYSGDTTVSEGTLALATITSVSPNSAFRLNTTVGANALLRLTYGGTANVRQLWIDGVQQPNGVYGSGTPGIDPTSTGTITVTGNAPVSLGVSQSGNALTFTWTGVYKLQTKTNNIIGPWFDYPGGGTSPVNVAVDHTKGSVFFRLSTY